MQPGNLVKITRASIGAPAGVLALIVSFYPARGRDVNRFDGIWEVQLLSGRNRRYLAQDLEIIE